MEFLAFSCMLCPMLFPAYDMCFFCLVLRLCSLGCSCVQMFICSCCACIVWYKTVVLFMIVLICGLTPLVIYESECLFVLRFVVHDCVKDFRFSNCDDL